MVQVHSARVVISIALAAFLAGCGGGGATTPNPPNKPQLAGGGRGTSSDDPGGGGENSGPQTPAFAPAPGYIPVLYADLNCFDAAFEQVITDQTALQAWWTTAISCQPRYNTRTPSPFADEDPNSGGGSEPGGGGSVDPEPYDPYPPTAPTVDFSDYAVVAIGLEEAAQYGRGLWIVDVSTTSEGTTIRYEVSTPGDDCFFGTTDQSDYAPMIAALVPGPLTTPVTFERTNTSWNCTWEPDPNEPWTIYYTDAPCLLGPNEAVITDTATWEQWLDAAYDCDLARWNDPRYNQPGTGVGGGSTEPGYDPDEDRDHPINDTGIDPAPPPPGSWGVDVDFSTHMIIVLRAGAQTRWGGGIWLNAINTTGGGTTYEYTVMQPAGNCPTADGDTLYPTVAIRVPKPAGAYNFVRDIETISCDWDETKPLPAPMPGGDSNGSPR